MTNKVDSLWLDEEHNYVLLIYSIDGKLYGHVGPVPMVPIDAPHSITEIQINDEIRFTVGPANSKEEIIKMAKEELKRRTG